MGQKKSTAVQKNKLATPMLRWKEESFEAESLSKGIKLDGIGGSKVKLG